MFCFFGVFNYPQIEKKQKLRGRIFLTKETLLISFVVTASVCAYAAQHTFMAPLCATVRGLLGTCMGVISLWLSQSSGQRVLNWKEDWEKMEVSVTGERAKTAALEGIAYQVNLP